MTFDNVYAWLAPDDEDVNDDSAGSARGGAGAESNSCVGEVIDSDSSSRKSEVRLAYVMMKIFL